MYTFLTSLHSRCRLLWASFILFIINLLLYIFIISFHSFLPFNTATYEHSYRYLHDARMEHTSSFTLLRALGIYDAQFYLRIADKGYPYHPRITSTDSFYIGERSTYAFFPFFPITVSLLNMILHNIELSAFIITNSFLFLGIYSLLSLISYISSEQIAIKTASLILLYPFSIFFRTYFTESLYLVLLIGFAYFLIKERLVFATICLAFLNITKATGWLLNLYLMFVIWKKWKSGTISSLSSIGLFFLLVIPSVIWIVFCWYQTGNPFYFFAVRAQWASFGYLVIFHNLSQFFRFDLLPIHGGHYSKIDMLSVFTVASLLFLSWRKLPKHLWWISFCLFISPLLVTDTMSYSRYQIVSFPLFFYVAKTLPQKYFFLISMLFIFLLGLTSLLLVNGYWLG